MFCEKCGAENVRGAKFCSQCGHKMGSEVKSGKSKGKLWLVAAVAVLAAAAVLLLMHRETDVVPAASAPAAAEPAEVLSLSMPAMPAGGTVSAGLYYSLYLRPDGTLAASPETPDRDAVLGWTNLSAVDAGNCHVVGLKTDGTVVATGTNETASWRGIVKVSTEGTAILGLRSDGTVAVCGGNAEVSGWTDIVDISAGRDHIVGVKADGTVVAVGDNTYGQCEVADWTDIIAVSTEENFTVGLKADGTVVLAGRVEDSYFEGVAGSPDLSGWRDIVAIATGIDNIYGLRSDGTVAAYSSTEYYCGAYGTGEPVSQWTGITAISASDHVIGLRADGSIVALGGNQFGECDVCRLQPETAEHMLEGQADGSAVCVICGYKTGAAAGSAAAEYAAVDPDCAHMFLDVISDGDGKLHRECLLCGGQEVREVMPLTALEPVRDSNSPGSTTDVGLGDWVSSMGTTIRDSIKFWVIQREGYSSKEYIDFDLGGNYETLAGTILAGKDCEVNAKMHIKIYLDSVVVGEYEDITVDTCTTFSLDVTGVQSMRILCTTYSNAFGHCIVQGYLA